MEIHQVVVSACPGDAITSVALELRALLRRIGPSEIYARYFDPALEGEVLPLGRYPERRSAGTGENLLLYHASIGEPEIVSFLLGRPERLVLQYHNITPPEFFVDYDLPFARLLAEGRNELVILKDRVVLAMGDSNYNASELEALGYRDVRVSPPVVDVESLCRSEPDDPTLERLTTQAPGPFLLFVGQLLPHKRPDYLLQAFSLLVTYLVPEARIALVGAPRLPLYHQALQRFLYETNLPDAWLCGSVSHAELVAFFRRADVFVTASEHEGFCIPLLEAMAFGVPVIARPFAAIPETLDEAGLLLPPDAGPVFMAEAMAEMIENRKLAGHLVARGAERLEDFEADHLRATFLGHLAAVV